MVAPTNATIAYKTNFGEAYVGDSLLLLNQLPDNSIDLVLTSPPFSLLRKKEYGNESQEDYVAWLAEFGALVFKKLKDSGSFVLDIGGAYQKGVPVRSLYPFRVLIHFCDVIGFHLAEEFYWYNSSKLPSPIEWVNKRKIRVKDSVNTVWWFSKTHWPKSDVSNVLTSYSDRMKKLLANPKAYYDSKLRPSGHDISDSFAKDNGGAIPSNLLQIPNSESSSAYLRLCKQLAIQSHPARFPSKLPDFFIRMLTEPNDLVVDIFAGSNTTGEVAESLKRNWLSFEINHEYVAGSVLRFMSQDGQLVSEVKEVYNIILANGSADIRNHKQEFLI